MSTESLHGLLASRIAPEAPDPLIGALAVPDTALPDVGDPGLPLALVNTGGAGQIAGPAGLAVRRGLALASITTTLADPTDLAGNVRRVVAAVEAARAEGAIAEDVAVRVVLPEATEYAWEAAADEVAAAEFEVALPLLRQGRPVPPPMLVNWIDGLLDRETGFAVLDVESAPQALGVLAVTAAAWDGLGTEEAVARLSVDLTAALDERTISTGRRWCRTAHVEDGPTVAEGLRSATS